MKKTLFLALLTLSVMAPALAQNESPAPVPETSVAPAEAVAAPEPELESVALVSQEDFDSAISQWEQRIKQQNDALAGLAQEIAGQNALITDGNGKIQEQTVLYEESSKRLDELNQQIAAAQVLASQLGQHVEVLAKDLKLSDADAAEKAAKIDALLQELTLLKQAKQGQGEQMTAQQVQIDALGEALASCTANLVEVVNTLELTQAEIALIHQKIEQQERQRAEQNARLAMEVAQLKLELPAQKKAQEKAMSDLVSNMASGMVLIFLCIVVISLIFRKHLRNIKRSIIDAVNEKLLEAYKNGARPAKPQGKGRGR